MVTWRTRLLDRLAWFDRVGPFIRATLQVLWSLLCGLVLLTLVLLVGTAIVLWAWREVFG